MSLLASGLACNALADDWFEQSAVFFNDSLLATIEITMDPDSFAWLLDGANLENSRYLSAGFRFFDGTLDTTIAEVGFRLRGNTSRYSGKKSFKIAFDAFGNETRVFGLKKLNLNGEHNDPSVIRSKLCWDLFTEVGVPASRAAHMRLYVNGEYRGLYIHVEEYDKTFLLTRFTNDNGNLFKCLWPADLAYLGSDPDLYKFESNGRRAYELKTNELADNYSDIARFISIISNTPDSLFMDSLEANFDVWRFLKALAIEAATGHWDNYWYNKNNFFLYNDPISGRFVYIPYDPDNTFGIWWDGIEWGIDWGNRNIYNWGNIYGQARPLTDRILSFQQYRNLYSYFMDELLDQYFNDQWLFDRINYIRPLIETAAEDDTYRTLDYGWSYADFLDSYNLSLGGHVTYGLRPYIITRNGSANGQLSTTNISPQFVSAPSLEFAANPDRIIVSTDVFDESALSYLNAYQIDGEQTTTWPMALLEMYDDGLAEVGHYEATIPLPQMGTEYGFYLEAMDNLSEVTTYPGGAPDSLLSFQIHGLLINELLASNDTTNTDEFGESDDWVELFNVSSSAINLSDWYLTDNPLVPDKYAFPDTTIAPQGFLLVWTDDDTEQGSLHTGFKLDRDGEFVGLNFFNGTTYKQADGKSFGLQATDISYGRDGDGNESWIFMTPTPGVSNSDNLPPEVSWVRRDPVSPGDAESVAVTARVVDSEGTVSSVLLEYDLGSGWTSVPMLDDGLHADGAAADSVFGAEIPGAPDGTIVNYYLEVTDNESASSTYPEGAPTNYSSYLVGREIPQLLINEFMADNETTIQDEEGVYEDWIEVFNPSGDTVDLRGLTLTDDFSRMNQWSFPDTVLAPSGFLLVWADDDYGTLGLHTNFKLSALGEEIALSDDPAYGGTVLDSMSFGEQSTDISLARICDGAFDWEFLLFATPDSSNGVCAVTELTALIDNTNLILQWVESPGIPTYWIYRLLNSGDTPESWTFVGSTSSTFITLNGETEEHSTAFYVVIASRD